MPYVADAPAHPHPLVEGVPDFWGYPILFVGCKEASGEGVRGATAKGARHLVPVLARLLPLLGLTGHKWASAAFGGVRAAWPGVCAVVSGVVGVSSQSLFWCLPVQSPGFALFAPSGPV